MSSPTSHLGFAQMFAQNRRTIRAPTNPMDKSTIVSIYPKDIHEVKHTIQPGEFFIQAGSYENPSILVVGVSSWWKPLEENQPLLEIPQSSIIVAKSIVDDFCNGMLACNMGDCMPGLFWVEGELSVRGITEKHKDRLDIANVKQRNWFQALIGMADSMWSAGNGNPRMISEHMKIAARLMGHEDKAWLRDFQIAKLNRCQACGSLRDTNYPICPTCKAVDKDHPKAKELKFAV